MEKLEYRTYGDTKDIKLCEHITVKDVEENHDEFPQCEYQDNTIISCTICKKDFDLNIKIN